MKKIEGKEIADWIFSSIAKHTDNITNLTANATPTEVAAIVGFLWGVLEAQSPSLGLMIEEVQEFIRENYMNYLKLYMESDERCNFKIDKNTIVYVIPSAGAPHHIIMNNDEENS